MERMTVPVPEIPVQLRINHGPIATWTCSPAHLRELGVGRALSLGYVAARDDVLAVRVLEPDAGIHTVEVDVPLALARAAEEQRAHRTEHGCGLRFLLDCRPDLLPQPEARAPVPATDDLAALFRELFERSPTRRTTGGHHTAALYDGRELYHVHEEVGRHNGVDKAIGAALADGAPLHRMGLLTTARISGEIAEKAARAGLAWVASRSVPTTLAVELASAAGVPLIARAAGSDARVFGAEAT